MQSQNFSFRRPLTSLLNRMKDIQNVQLEFYRKQSKAKLPSALDFALTPRKIPKKNQRELNSTYFLCYRILTWLL